jgi:16S rRNA (guanine1207-N2)-methyltransferase
MGHYFVNDDSLRSEKRNLYFNFKGFSFKFSSDNGVFSKNEIDEGSEILLTAFLNSEKRGRTLDVGAGVGVIGITIAKVTDSEVDMLEINKRAVGLCEENIILNGVSNCKVYESDIYEKANGRYDVVISNPPIRAGKKVVFEILEKAKEYLNEQGELWVVIRKNQGADSAKKKMTEVYGNCEIVKRDSGFYILKSAVE